MTTILGLMTAGVCVGDCENVRLRHDFLNLIPHVAVRYSVYSVLGCLPFT